MNLKNISVLECTSQKEFENWLERNHTIASEVWIRFYKKSSCVQSIVYLEALDIALCYGWIDSLVKKYDDISYIQKFSPRKSKSMWSKVNRQNIERLVRSGKMKPDGLLQVEAAKKDGRWKAAYDSPATASFPHEFYTILNQNNKAKEFFNSLNKTNKYAIAWRIQTAKKQETKEKRIKEMIEMLSNGKKFH